jgi:Domain of unknown function (DUF6265)
MKHSLVLLCGLLMMGPGVTSADQPKKSYTLKDVAWFAGQWKSPASEKLTSEEHWSEPAVGAMIGMFRLTNAEKPLLYEFLMMDETPDGVTMRLRHFKTAMAEVEKEPIRLKLTKASSTEAVFENPDNEKPKRITYRLDQPNQISVVVETTRDGKSAAFTLKFEKVKK